MTLQVAKTPSYLSPSSLRVLERTPNTFYCQRMAPDPIPYEPQGISAGVGSSFDYFVKMDWLKKNSEKMKIVRDRVYNDIYNAEEKKRLQSAPLSEMMWKTAVEEQNRDEGERMGKQIMDIYTMNGYASLKLVDVEIHRRFNLFCKDLTVPLFMKLDAIAYDPFASNGEESKDSDLKVCPFDWKVKGYGSKSGVSPTKGYYALYAQGTNKGSHKDYVTDIPADRVDPHYATQLCTYGWGMGYSPGTPFRGLIDEIVMRPNNIRVARYRLLITEQFQLDLINRYEAAWRSLKDGSFVGKLCQERKLVEMAAATENWYDSDHD